MDPTAPAPVEWRQSVQHFLERWNRMRFHWRVRDTPASINCPEGHFGCLKPRVRRALSFQTVAGTRNFLQAVSHAYT